LKDNSRLTYNLRKEAVLTNLAIEFYTCSCNKDNEFLNDIKKVLMSKCKPEDGYGQMWINRGAFTIDDFQYYCQYMMKGSFPLGVSDVVVEGLLKENVIIQFNPSITKTNKVHYSPDFEFAKSLKENGLLKNLLFGYNYIINKYKTSVILIEVDKKGLVSVGTGFLITHEKLQFVVTNKHVVEDSTKVTVYLNNEIIKYKDIILSKNSDIGFIELSNNSKSPSFYLNAEMDVLREIITIGYPSIPMTNDAYQVYHKGEINSFVQDYNGNDLFLISAKTSSGNSGSPVIDKYGSVVGMVTEELFEKDSFFKKGKLPYYASIPSSKIISELESLIKIS